MIHINLYININEYCENNIYFYEKNHNNNNLYHRINYSINNISLNSLIFRLPFQYIHFEPYFDKFKCVFIANEYNKMLVGQLQFIEKNILDKLPSKKNPQYNIYNQLCTGCIKLNTLSKLTSQSNFIVLKINGVWESKTDVGLTFRFIQPDASL